MNPRLLIALLSLVVLQAGAAVTQLNVLSFGVSTNSSDNAAAIQKALTAAGQLSANLFWPAGTYYSSALTAPAGNYSISGENVPGIKFPSQSGTRLVLKGGAAGPLLTVPNGASVNVNGIYFDGNSSNATTGAALVLVQPIVFSGTRNETRFNNCVFWGSPGIGLQIQREEVYVKDSSILTSVSHGLHLDSGATDCTIDYVGSGFNGGDGYHLTGNTSAGRWLHWDSYYNQGHGIFIDGDTGCGDLRFYLGQCNVNFKDNIHLQGVLARVSFMQTTVFSANADNNSRGVNNPAASGTYSDISIEGNSYTTDFSFVACAIGVPAGSSQTKKPYTGLRDLRSGTYSNGKGITIIGGVLAGGGNFTSTLSYSPATLDERATILGALNEQSELTPSRLGKGALWMSGPIYFDGLTNKVTMYEQEPGGLTFELNGTGAVKKYVGFYTNGWSSFPGTLSTDGNITNRSGSLFNYGSMEMTALGRTLFYQDAGGGLGIGAGYAGPNQKFMVLGTNGVATATDFKWKVGAVTNLGVAAFTQLGSVAQFYQHQSGGLALMTTDGGGVNHYLAYNADGSVAFPDDLTVAGNLTASLLALTTLNAGTLTATNGVRYTPLASGPAAAAIGAGNGQMWLSNDVSGTLYFRFTSDGVAVTDTKLAP